MTIRREYSLPNCTLVLEGLSANPAQTERLPLDVLIRFECHLSAEKPLVGGRDFLEKLAAAVSQFAQEFLSGVRRGSASFNGHAAPIQLKSLDTNLFRIIVQLSLVSAVAGATPDTDSSQLDSTIETDLSTVQLFDLVEAFDQLFADTQTLPDLLPSFSPLSRKDSTSRQPVTEQAAPVVLGVTSLALAAVALFFVPIPEVEKRTPIPQTPSQTVPQPPSAPERSPEPSQDRSSTVLAIASNPQQLEKLNQKLYTQIDQAWKTQPGFKQDLIYQVGVNQNAKITGYRAVNQAALDFTQEVPLLQLLDVPAPGTTALKPSVQFQVVFTPSGRLQVSPWGGYQ